MTPDEAYRAGVCVDCQDAEQSAGRPRCDYCHAIYVGEHANGWRV